MLVVAANLLEAESVVKVEEREKYLAEKCPPLELPYSRDELMVSPDLTVDRDNTSESCGGSVVEATPSKRVSLLVRNSARSSISRSASVRRSDTASSLNSTWF